MTATTIKVPSELRDRLKNEAAQEGHTMSEHIEKLLDEDSRRQRFSRLREQIAANPPDDEYVKSAEEWQADQW
ncbi:MAG: ribbon-helix-helix protein [Ancrocorticia sp.]|uniref:ribbon-helix-helix protein n=1 Tax=Ancrocorticia sp. TaxID=2593684 RepID=UPI003F8DCC4F